MEKRNVQLPNGQTLELEATERFYEAIRYEFKLEPFSPITDEQISTFIHGTMKNAVDKAEKEIKE